jgi:transglutaminase-like putative cysteine protease
VPPPEALYWRGPVFDHYDGRTWRAAQPGERIVPVTRPRVEVDPASRIDYTVTLEPHRRDWILALDLPLAPPLAPELRTRLTPALELVSAMPIESRLRYEASSALRYAAGAATPALELRNWVELPPGLNPRTQTLAAQLRAQYPPAPGADAALVNALLSRFRREDYRYTLEPPPLGEHAVDDFLFETRAGYCEHYASATAVLLRALDIPARIVTGYQGGELNPTDGQFTVRQSDAHAWVEAWLQGRGWVRIDPTAAVAPSRVERGATRAAREAGLLPGAGLVVGADWLRHLRFGFEAAQNTWNQWVLSYSAERQRALVRRLGLDPDWHGLALAFALAVAALMAGAGGLAWWRARRSADPLALAWEGLRERVAGAGVDAPPWIGPHELARRSRRSLAEADALHAQRLAAELEALRYAPVPADAAPRVRALRRAVRHFRPRPRP